MTTIAWDGKILATDSGGLKGDIALGKEKKLYKIGEFLTATAGLVTDGFLFRKWLEDGGDLSQFPILGLRDEISENFLITKDGAFTNWGQPVLVPIKEIKACGSGENFAISAMSLGMNAIEAVIHACRLDAHSRGKVQWGYFDDDGVIQIGETTYEGMDERERSSGYFGNKRAGDIQSSNRNEMQGCM